MADVPNPDLIRNPLGAPTDDPATAEQCGPGYTGGGATIFALLKGILLQLADLNSKPDAN